MSYTLTVNLGITIWARNNAIWHIRERTRESSNCSDIDALNVVECVGRTIESRKTVVENVRAKRVSLTRHRKTPKVYGLEHSYMRWRTKHMAVSNKCRIYARRRYLWNQKACWRDESAVFEIQTCVPSKSSAWWTCVKDRMVQQAGTMQDTSSLLAWVMAYHSHPSFRPLCKQCTNVQHVWLVNFLVLPVSRRWAVDESCSHVWFRSMSCNYLIVGYLWTL